VRFGLDACPGIGQDVLVILFWWLSRWIKKRAAARAEKQAAESGVERAGNT
jgi:hypothetical protein